MASVDIIYLDEEGKRKVESWACGSMNEALLLADDACRKAILIDGGDSATVIPSHRILKVVCTGERNEPTKLVDTQAASLRRLVVQWAVVADEPCAAGQKCETLQLFLSELKEILDANSVVG